MGEECERFLTTASSEGLYVLTEKEPPKIRLDRLRVRDLMTAEVFAVRPDDDLTAVRDVLYDRHVRHVPVVDDEHNLVGIVSHRDLLRYALIEQADLPRYLEEAVLEELTVAEIMNPDVERVEPDTDIREAAQIMFENKYGCLAVVVGESLVGILTEADFVRFLALGT